MMGAPHPVARVAFFGGSFDPPHLGHLAVARAARDALRLDTVLFAPVGSQPLKPRGPAATFAARLAMTELAIAGERGFAVSLLDAPGETGQPNYTLLTLRRLQAERAESALFFLMGADSFLTLRHWYEAAEIPFTASLVVASRPGQSLGDLRAALPDGLEVTSVEDPGCSAVPQIELHTYAVRNAAGQCAKFHVLPGLDVEISASEIRAQLQYDAAGEAARPLLPAAVTCYIREHGLYR